MRKLNFELKLISNRNRDGSETTRANRERILSLVANQLHDLGYKNLSAKGLKPKHIESLVKSWQEENLSTGTIKNRLSAVRWWAEKINKSSLIASSNDFYGVARRIYKTNKSKAILLDPDKHAEIDDEYIKFSLRLQSEFGLRREESIKFNASWADRTDHIQLKSSWTKGGRERTVQIRTESQRQLIDEIKLFVRNKSLIPVHLSYIKHRRRYEDKISKAGIHKAHGLRHQYAQNRYFELTGMIAPAAGGKTSNKLNSNEKRLDYDARLIISRELGHEREEITSVYLGR